MRRQDHFIRSGTLQGVHGRAGRRRRGRRLAVGDFGIIPQVP